MRRFFWLFGSEVRLFRTTITIHLVAILQPTILYLLMTGVLVHPTFEMNVLHPETDLGWALVQAMRQVGSPIGAPYIDPVLVASAQAQRQVVVIEERQSALTAVQYYGLIDSNLVKNFRNRLTAAALVLWNQELGDRAVRVEEHPWLPRDVPYTLYFGVAILPLTAVLAASIVGGILTAQEFEFGTILEYRLSPVSPGLILGARLARLVLTSLFSAGVLLAAIGLVTGVWPASFWRVGLILLPVAVFAASLGVTAGLFLRSSIPAFLVGLLVSFVGWILGSAFGLAASFGGAYEFFSRLTPNTQAVELLFPLFYGARVGRPLVSALALALMGLAMLGIVTYAYRRRVLRQE
ncbi:MAG: ABC transporter permease [Anaerolineales bacterium]|nr:ABC transporter permease [Anaerolineales bacterium]